jgi:hypothetical protein
MKLWYHKKFDMYVPKNPWWHEPDWDNELVEVEVEKEEIILNGGSDSPSFHSERWESDWWDEESGQTIFTKYPWPFGKYKITIEPLEDE